MARKGILPRRKRGRTAGISVLSTPTISSVSSSFVGTGGISVALSTQQSIVSAETTTSPTSVTRLQHQQYQQHHQQQKLQQCHLHFLVLIILVILVQIIVDQLVHQSHHFILHIINYLI